jgi:uncharacterized Fe-S cluster-containing radical SAM superfamily protein
MAHVVDHCNLNCKACNNFSSLQPLDNFRSVEEYEKSLQRIQTLFDNVMLLGLQGGEPLLNPQLTLEFARTARKYFPLANIVVYTNALRIPQIDDAIFAELTNLNIEIFITVYPDTEKMFDKAIAKLDANNTKWFVFGERAEFNKYLTLYPFEDVNYNKEHCISASCRYLSHEKLYKCVEAGNVYNFDVKFGTSLFQESGLDIYEFDNGWDIARKLTDACYLCAYCAKHANIKTEWNNDRDYKPDDWIVPHRFERQRKNDKKVISDLKKQNLSLEEVVHGNASVLDEQLKRVALLERSEKNYIKQIKDLQCSMQLANYRLSAMENSACWKITKPVRVILDFIKERLII